MKRCFIYCVGAFVITSMIFLPVRSQELEELPPEPEYQEEELFEFIDNNMKEPIEEEFEEDLIVGEEEIPEFELEKKEPEPEVVVEPEPEPEVVVEPEPEPEVVVEPEPVAEPEVPSFEEVEEVETTIVEKEKEEEDFEEFMEVERAKMVEEAKEVPVEAIPSEMELMLKVYTVRRGDTLWDTAGNFYRNPFLWPDIWVYNKYIKDPHWIFPGDNLIIPIPGQRIARVPEKRIIQVEEVLERVEKLEDRYLFITAPEVELDGHIIALKKRKIMPISGDYVFIDRGKSDQEEKGNVYSIYKKGDRVVHPLSGEYLGIIVTKVGELQVTNDIQDHNSAARIVACEEPILVGYMIKSKE